MSEKVYLSMYSRNAELYHHGIKGQKWGVQNGPPYPLGSDKSTGKRLKKDISEIKDNYIEEKKKMYKNRLEKIDKKQNKISKEQEKLNKKNENLEARKAKIQNFINKHSDDKSKGTTEDIIDIIAPSAITLASILAFIGITSAAEHISTESEIKKNIEKSEKTGPLNKISGPHDIKKDSKMVNPNYDPGSKKYSMNCALCSATYDMRRRGYDVTAMPSEKGRYLKQQARMYNMTSKDVNKVKDYADFKQELNAMPNGARGIMNVAAGDFGSGHAVAWEKQNGKILIIDAQDNKIYDFKSATSSKPPLINVNLTTEYKYFRTDDKDFNEKYIRDACKNRR